MIGRSGMLRGVGVVAGDEIEVRHDGLRPEDDLRPVLGDVDAVRLRDDVGDVVGHAKVVLTVVVRAVLAGDLQASGGLDGAASLDLEEHLVRDVVDDEDLALDVELLGLLGEILRDLVGVGLAAGGETEETASRERGDQETLHTTQPPSRARPSHA
jgi:hypothetical protein